MKRYVFILMIAILLGSCSKANQGISKVKQIETNKPPISSKDMVHHDDKGTKTHLVLPKLGMLKKK